MKDYSVASRRRRSTGERLLFGALLLATVAVLIAPAGIARAATYETLYSFKGNPDGAEPEGALVIGANGALYGTTFAGGSSALGTVFEMTKPAGESWQETVLHDFQGSDGQYPQSALTLGSSGALYGVTVGGGSGGSGTIFELAPPSAAGSTWALTDLYSFVYFTGNGQNAVPNGPVLIGSGGTLYTTTQGGPDGPEGATLGLVIALVPPATSGGAWAEYQLYAFGFPQGEVPPAGVVSGGGSLFGTTALAGAGACECGTVYELTPPQTHTGTWAEATIHIFGEIPGDGSSPRAGLATGPGGTLYGTTYYGGTGVCYTSGGLTSGCGTVFQLTPPTAPGGTWTYSVIYSFTGANGDGAAPLAGVVVGQDGSIYGTTSSAGSAASNSACPASYYVIGGCGIVYKLTSPSTPGSAWTETVLHSFSGQNGDGAIPVAGLVLSPAGVLFGTTSAGGTAGKGTVFAVVE